MTTTFASRLILPALVGANFLILAAGIFATIVLLVGLAWFGITSMDLVLAGTGVLFASGHAICLRLADGKMEATAKIALLGLSPLPSLAFVVLVFAGPT